MHSNLTAVRYIGPDGAPRLGALSGDVVRDAGPAPAAGFVPSPEGWALIEAAAGEEHALSDVELLHPVQAGKILAIAVNYRAHAEESELDVPAVPVMFAKFPSSLIGSGAPIVVPREETRPDFEGEVAVVIGRRTYRADEASALEAVGGISALNDVSGRRAQLETPLRQFTLGKSFDSFTPMGPGIVHPAGLDLGSLALETTVSGELMQKASTRDLIHSIATLIVYLSAGTTLEPGDVIATGTPSGVGDSRTPPRYLREGDVVEVTVEGVGTLRNPVTLER
ncbi:MAG TPA: fumarylacetoacetate hydrolase family protein [Solirubrobacteraceae bacterium]|nr:fumarylacetoacetate hydrolase family protein [Solirubrobacteraceae bacterium]